MAEIEIEDDKPLVPPKIISTEVLNNPFDDIEPRETKKKVEPEKPKEKKKGTK